MIDQAVTFVARRLDEALRALYVVDEPLVAVAPVADSEGKMPGAVRNKLALFIANIADDQMPRPSRGGFGEVRRAPPVHLDVYIMLAAAFEPDAYGEGLKLLASAMRVFQANPTFSQISAPDMPPGLGQLGIEIANLRNDEVGQLWGNLGGRYLPSVMYKLRSVPIDAAAVVEVPPLIRDPSQSAETTG